MVSRVSRLPKDVQIVCKACLQTAIPAGQTLVGPLDAYAVSTTFRTSLRNEAYHLQIGSSRVYNMVGAWKSFDVGYTNRDGSVGADGNLLFVRPLRTLNAAEAIEIRDFTTVSVMISGSSKQGDVRD